MKKSRLALAIILAFILIIICISVPTVSWFTRPYPIAGSVEESQAEGEKMKLNAKNKYVGYNGYDVTISTASSSDGTNNSYTTPVTNSAGLSVDLDDSTTYVPCFEKKYFCTTITNNSGTDQNVSLYASELTIPADTNGKLALGVNEPTRSYRDYTSLTKKKYNVYKNYDKRIYFQTANVAGWGYPHDIYVTFGYEYGTDSRKMNYIKDDTSYGRIFYADIPYSANNVYFTSSGWMNSGNNGGADNTMHSKTVSIDGSLNSVLQSKLFRIKNETDGYDNNYRKVIVENFNGASIAQYYNDITLATNANFNATTDLQYHPNATVKYYSSDSNVFTVGETTGQLQGVGAGTATLYTKVICNAYGDYIQKETTVTVTSNNSYIFNDVPIVKNLLIPGAAGSNQNNPANVVKVYWYILNISESSSLRYEIDQIYLGP